MICIICAQSRPYVFTAQENKIDFSFLSTFITSVQMNVGHIPARSIFMQPTLERARELLESRGGSCHFFSYGFLFSRFSAKFACITLRARCQLKGVLTKGAPPSPSEGESRCRDRRQRLRFREPLGRRKAREGSEAARSPCGARGYGERCEGSGDRRRARRRGETSRPARGGAGGFLHFPPEPAKPLLFGLWLHTLRSACKGATINYPN